MMHTGELPEVIALWLYHLAKRMVTLQLARRTACLTALHCDHAGIHFPAIFPHDWALELAGKEAAAQGGLHHVKTGFENIQLL